jgi:hypothetical protein
MNCRHGPTVVGVCIPLIGYLFLTRPGVAVFPQGLPSGASFGRFRYSSRSYSSAAGYAESEKGAVMGSCAAQTFSGISAGQFACLLKKVSDSGVSVSGNSGSASKDGITIGWEFDPASSTLQVQCTSAPFFVSCGMVNSRIHDLVDECASAQG